MKQLDMIKQFNDAVSYIEANLYDEISYDIKEQILRRFTSLHQKRKYIFFIVS